VIIVFFKHIGIDDLFSKYRFGIVASYVYPKELKDRFLKYAKNKMTATDEKSLLEMLQAKRFDFAITDPKVIQHYLKGETGSELSVIKVLMNKKLVLSLRDTSDNKSRIKKLQKILSETK
jgi:polar amino acid transport system substrate-binding protein